MQAERPLEGDRQETALMHAVACCSGQLFEYSPVPFLASWCRLPTEQCTQDAQRPPPGRSCR